MDLRVGLKYLITTSDGRLAFIVPSLVIPFPIAISGVLLFSSPENEFSPGFEAGSDFGSAGRVGGDDLDSLSENNMDDWGEFGHEDDSMENSCLRHI